MNELDYYKKLCELQNDVISAMAYNKLSDSEENQKWVSDAVENLKNFYDTIPEPSSELLANPYGEFYFDDRNDSSATLKISKDEYFPKTTYNPDDFNPKEWDNVQENSVEFESVKALDKLMTEKPELVKQIMDEVSKMNFEGPTVEKYFNQDYFKRFKLYK